ncbi:MAG: hypothetical protein V1926_02160 [Candidatus Peregrinibacteria bacterium]
MPILLRIAAGLALMTAPIAAHAISVNPCPFSGFLDCNSIPATISGLSVALRLAFYGFVFLMIVFYGVKLLFGMGEETSHTEAKTAFGYAIFGSVLVLGSLTLGSIFANTNPAVGIQYGSLTADGGIIWNIVNFVLALTGSALVIALTIQGIRLIASQDEAGLGNAKKGFVLALIGAAVVILAQTLVNAVTGGSAASASSTLVTQIAGIVGFLSMLFGALAVVAIVVGGFMLIISYDDALKDKAKKLIIGGLIAIAVVSASSAIIQLVIF